MHVEQGVCPYCNGLVNFHLEDNYALGICFPINNYATPKAQYGDLAKQRCPNCNEDFMYARMYK
jgi:hypothetical protein